VSGRCGGTSRCCCMRCFAGTTGLRWSCRLHWFDIMMRSFCAGLCPGIEGSKRSPIRFLRSGSSGF